MTTKEILEVLNTLQENDFDDKTRQEIQKMLHNKVSSIYYVIKSLEKDIEYFKEVIDKYKSKINSTQNKIDFLKDLMLKAVKQQEIKYITDEEGVILHTIQVRQSQSLVITDESNIPDDFKKISYTIDKNKIKEYILQGNTLENCYIETKDYLIIR